MEARFSGRSVRIQRIGLAGGRYWSSTRYLPKYKLPECFNSNAITAEESKILFHFAVSHFNLVLKRSAKYYGKIATY